MVVVERGCSSAPRADRQQDRRSARSRASAGGRCRTSASGSRPRRRRPGQAADVPAVRCGGSKTAWTARGHPGSYSSSSASCSSAASSDVRRRLAGQPHQLLEVGGERTKSSAGRAACQTSNASALALAKAYQGGRHPDGAVAVPAGLPHVGGLSGVPGQVCRAVSSSPGESVSRSWISPDRVAIWEARSSAPPAGMVTCWSHWSQPSIWCRSWILADAVQKFGVVGANHRASMPDRGDRRGWNRASAGARHHSGSSARMGTGGGGRLKQPAAVTVPSGAELEPGSGRDNQVGQHVHVLSGVPLDQEHDAPSGSGWRAASTTIVTWPRNPPMTSRSPPRSSRGRRRGGAGRAGE